VTKTRAQKDTIKKAPRQTYILCNWQIHAHKKTPSQNKIVPGQTYMLGNLQKHAHKKTPSPKKNSPCAKFLFTLSHDLSAPPTLRFFSLRSKNSAGSQLRLDCSSTGNLTFWKVESWLSISDFQCSHKSFPHVLRAAKISLDLVLRRIWGKHCCWTVKIENF